MTWWQWLLVNWWQWLLVIPVVYLAVWSYLVYGKGPFRFVYWKPMAWVLDLIGMSGITIGARCYSRTPELIADSPNGLEPFHLPYLSWQRRWWRHEKTHFWDWRMRPFFGPVYAFWLIVKKYKGHPDELRAIREAGQPERP